jgi:hypothetical protein
MNHLGSGHVLINKPASQPGGLPRAMTPSNHQQPPSNAKQRETRKAEQYGSFAANRQQTVTPEIIFEEKPRAGTFSAWLDVDPGTTARRAREEAT